MSFELLKVLVQPVIAERDKNGVVVGEQFGEPNALYTAEQVIEFFETVRGQLIKVEDTN